MANFPKIALILSFLLLAACAEQTVDNKKPATPKAVAATPAASPKPAPSNVRLSETNHNSEGTYYVQNRVLASGGVVSGALMGS